MDPDQLPKEGYNRGIVVPLRCCCPPDCPCKVEMKAKQVKNWHHSFCGDPAFVNSYGEIFCKHFKEKPECDGYFIQYSGFQCSETGKSKTWRQQDSCGAAPFQMRVALALQAAEFILEDCDLMEFNTTLCQEMPKRWSR